LARIDVDAMNERGVLARIASEIAQADSNITNVSMHEEENQSVILHLTVQVSNRKHLAQVFRAIRHVPQVQRISRVKGIQKSGVDLNS